ncbi:MFS transporter [Runella sp.]|uniref:MFS transporter n=1 Tax=Runella sp. TaxID=1960881 RepID=UPI003D0B3CE3
MSSSPKTTLQYLFQLPVLVAALGYLVDMYDLFLFSVVRVPSLKAIGVTGDQLLPQGLYLLNMQLAGLLVGGVVWGILGDKKGRLSVLFGSILLYSLANIGNGMITNMTQYAVLRFIAGIGLAGELGAGITLVAEVLPKHLRGYGSMMVATMGVLGGVLAYFVADLFEWRMSYYVGGGLGLLLLVLRVNIFESGLFVNLRDKNIQRGNISMLLKPQRLIKYLLAILVGVPLWFVVGILITFSPEFGISHGLADPIIAGKAVMLAFTGQTFGDIVSGFLSQRLQSRKKAIRIFILMSFMLMVVYLMAPIQTNTQFYILCVCLGFCNGYWTLFIILAAELFGTNLRATVATTVPNFVRGATIPLGAAFITLKPSLGVINGALVIGIVVVVISLVALQFLEETFTKDMNYEEQ